MLERFHFPTEAEKNEGDETGSVNARTEIEIRSFPSCAEPMPLLMISRAVFASLKITVICLWLLLETEGVALKTQSKYSISRLREDEKKYKE